MKIYSFPPISDKNAEVLILGTMPGAMSLKLNQYYGHGGNIFWKLIFAIFDEPFTMDYEVKKNILLKNKIALWDVLKACEREGSSDNAILQETSNDFKSFFDYHKNIRLIAFNGKNAEAYFKNFLSVRPKVKYITLPSTSPANTWKTFDEKSNEWKAIKMNV
jgi:hypoxanthine-DNA glycosylase